MMTETWNCRSLRNLYGRRDERVHSYLELYAIDDHCQRTKPPQLSNCNYTHVLPRLASPPADWKDQRDMSRRRGEYIAYIIRRVIRHSFHFIFGVFPIHGFWGRYPSRWKFMRLGRLEVLLAKRESKQSKLLIVRTTSNHTRSRQSPLSTSIYRFDQLSTP